MLYLSASGAAVRWNDLDEAERAFYLAPLADNLPDHICRYWNEADLTELFFDDASLVPD